MILRKINNKICHKRRNRYVGVLLDRKKKPSFTHKEVKEALRTNPGQFVPSVGLEPTTVGLEVRCAVQLRYEGKTP